MTRDPNYSPFKPTIPKVSQPGEGVWRLCEPGTQRVQSCELRNDSKAGAGWDV